MNYYYNKTDETPRTEAQAVHDIINIQPIDPIEEEDEVSLQEVWLEEAEGRQDGSNLDQILRLVQPPLSRVIPRGMVERLIQDPGLGSTEQFRLDALLATFLLKTHLYKKDVRVRQHKKSDKSEYVKEFLRFVLTSMDRQDELLHVERVRSPRSPSKRVMEDDRDGKKDCFREWLHEPNASLGPRSAHSSPAVPDIGHRVANDEGVNNQGYPEISSSYDQLAAMAFKRRRTDGSNNNANDVTTLPPYYDNGNPYFYVKRNVPANTIDNLNSNTRRPRAWSSDEDESSDDDGAAANFHNARWYPPQFAHGTFSDRPIADYLADICGPPRSARFATIEDSRPVTYVTSPARIMRRASPFVRHPMMAVSDDSDAEEEVVDRGTLSYYQSTQDVWHYMQDRIRYLPSPPPLSPRSDSGDNAENTPCVTRRSDPVMVACRSKSLTQAPRGPASLLPPPPGAAICPGRGANSQQTTGAARLGDADSALRVRGSAHDVPVTYLLRSLSAPCVLETAAAGGTDEGGRQARAPGAVSYISSYVNTCSLYSSASGPLYSSESDHKSSSS